MSQPILSLGVWVSLPNEVRHKIRSIFSIPKSRATEVDDGKLVSDGTTHEDLKVLDVVKMQAYTGETETDFYKLFDKVVAKVNDGLYPKTTVASQSDSVTVIIEPKKRGRPRTIHGTKK